MGKPARIVGGSDGPQASGRMRHILTDTIELLLAATAHPPISRTGMGRNSCWRTASRGSPSAGSMRRIMGTVSLAHPDTGLGESKSPAPAWVKAGQDPPERPTGFLAVPRRWVVERTFAWWASIAG